MGMPIRVPAREIEGAAVVSNHQDTKRSCKIQLAGMCKNCQVRSCQSPSRGARRGYGNLLGQFPADVGRVLKQPRNELHVERHVIV